MTINRNFNIVIFEMIGYNNKVYDLSRAVYNLYINKDVVQQKLKSIPETVLKDLWKVPVINSDRFGQWLTIVTNINPECECLT